MASREEWCDEKLSKLLDEDLRISTLNEIKDHLRSVPQEEVVRTANVLHLPLVFDCLNNSNTEQIDLACEVLSLCMNNLNLGESTNRYGVSLERALTHPYPAVKLMALKEIERNVLNEQVVKDLCRRVSLLNNIIRCVEDNDLSVVKKASEIICILAQSSVGVKQLASPEILTVFHEVMSVSEVVRLRVYEVIISICKDSESSFKELKGTGILAQIVEELNNNDVLLRMNIVELLTQLGLSEHGYSYLEANGVLNKLFLSFDEEDDPVTLQLCEPGILKFFGNMAHWKPIEVLSKYPKLFDRLFSNIESSDLTIIAISLDTLGHIGITNEGKCALDSTGNKINYAIKIIVRLLTSLPTEIRVRALNCLQNLIHVQEQKTHVCAISRRWYSLFGDNPMDVVLKYAKNPFSELRLAGFGILNAIAGQTWGHDEIKNTPGLLEFLTDRSSETTKECKEAKYEIIKLLSESTVFDQLVLKRLQHFVQEGPFYVAAVTEVAIEGNE